MPSSAATPITTRLAGPKRQTSKSASAGGRRESVLEVRARDRATLDRIKTLIDEAMERPDPVVALANRLLAQTPPDVVARQGQLRNLAVANFLGRYPLLTAAQLDRLGGREPSKSNPFARASRWKKDGRIFSVRWQGADRFPEFQFAAGEPIAALREILPLVGRTADGWGEALWFAAPHAFLGGRAPGELLASGDPGDADRALAAARWQFGDEAP